VKIEILKLSEIKPYIGNAKQHPDWHIKQIASSIEEFGFNDPIAIDENNTIIEGHGRAMAAELLKLETVPVIKLTHMSEAQRKAYIIAHNKLTMNTDFDLEKLRVEMDELKIMDFDLDWIGFDLDLEFNLSNEDGEYTKKITAPTYEPKNEKPHIGELLCSDKVEELKKEITESESISKEDKRFLILAAQRHAVFNYSKIADYYAHSDKDVQELMEKSALVIIDFDKAIENGYVKLSAEIAKQYLRDYPDDK